MSQFRTTADIVDLALRNAGEVTNGNSPYEAQILDYLNRVHFTMISGGTIPIGKDQTVEIDEVWPWAKASRPLILELQPMYQTGTMALVQGSEAGVFSNAPSFSAKGWFFRVQGRPEIFRIAQHTAASVNFELDAAYTADSGSLNFSLFKLDYDLIPDFIVVDEMNDKVQFQKVAGTTISATLTKGTYTPAQLATHVAAVITAAASGPTISGAYDSITRLFSFTSNLAGPTIFRLVGDGSFSLYSVHKTIGFDDVTTASAATQTSTYALGGICRLIEPIRVHRANNYSGVDSGSIYGIDSESFQRDYPLFRTREEIPSKFFVLNERADGSFTVRFNAFPKEKTRIEIEHIPVPRDLKDSAASVPIVPRKHVDVLEDAATFYVMLNKSDDRAQLYANLMQGKLKAMIAQHRGSLVRTGYGFGQIVPRRDQLQFARRRNFFGPEST